MNTSKLSRVITLTQGQSCIVDQDQSFSTSGRWHASWCASVHGFYAARCIKENGKTIRVYMHREIMGLSRKDARIVDHINHNTLDNRKENLRLVDKYQQAQNRLKRWDRKKSQFRGVTYRPKSKSRPYVAKIQAFGKVTYLGAFCTAKEAYDAYCNAAKELHGEFACLD